MTSDRLLKEMVMCVKADDVLFDDGFTEFSTSIHNVCGHLFYLLNSATFKPRSKIEGDDSFKQIVVYIIIRKGSKSYSYARTGGEGRSVGDYSIGVGGHVNVNDSKVADFHHVGAVEIALWREFHEEVVIDSDCSLSASSTQLEGPIGVINYSPEDIESVHRAHLGIVYAVNVADYVRVSNKDENIHKAGFTDLDELMENLEDYEGWSQLLILEYLGRV